MKSDSDLLQWLQLLLKAFRRLPVLLLAVIGPCEIIAAAFVDGYWQAFLLQVGTVLIFISPIVVTERIAVSEEVKQLRAEVKRLSEIQQAERTRIQRVEQLFRPETGYTLTDLLALLKAALIDQRVPRCGVAVPLMTGSYDMLLGLSLDPSIGKRGVYFQPRYVIEGQDEIQSRILYKDRDERESVVLLTRLLNLDREPSLSGMFMGMRSELLGNERHPSTELDFEGICARIKQVLTLGFEARQPGSKYRTGLGPVIAIVGSDLAITVEGIEHIWDSTTRVVSKFDVWKRAGLPDRVPNQSADVGDLVIPQF